MYRSIPINDWTNSKKNIILYYNKCGESNRNFYCQNNDFGWTHLPLSYIKENTVLLLVTAMLKNFYLYVLRAIASIASIASTPESPCWLNDVGSVITAIGKMATKSHFHAITISSFASDKYLYFSVLRCLAKLK